MLRVRDKLDQGAMVGMLADRSIGDDALLPDLLVGGVAGLPTGAFRMAALLRASLVFMWLYLGGNRYQINSNPGLILQTRPAAGAQVKRSPALCRPARSIRGRATICLIFLISGRQPAAGSDAKPT